MLDRVREGAVAERWPTGSDGRNRAVQSMNGLRAWPGVI